MATTRFHIHTPLLVIIAMMGCSVFTIHEACAQWNQIAQFNAGNVASVIYFLDAKTGFVGLENNGENEIWRSTDSGVTWVATTIPPNSIGYVTDIWFSASNDGWATIGGAGVGQLWHTTDTGNIWVQCSSFTFSFPSSVRRTSKSLCVSGSGFGVVFSVDNGATFTQGFTEPMRGLDLVDSLHIACTPLSSSTYYYSSDGGISWLPSNPLVGDAWGIRGVKGSSTYFVAPENQLNLTLTSNVYRSDDYGATWAEVCELPFKTTGDIKGSGCGMFIQNSNWIPGSLRGVYRSTDDGLTWTNIGGPTNTFDTRFEVINTGTAIYAFDEFGGLWKDVTPINSVQFTVAANPDPIKPGDTLTVTVTPNLAVQGTGLTSISGTMEYHSDAYKFISATGGAGTAQLQYTLPFAVGETAYLPFTISSPTDILLDPATPIFTLYLQTMVSDTTVSSFTLDSLLLNGSDPNYGNCVFSPSSNGAVSHIQLACGDTLLMLAMSNELALGVENPQPNPLTAENGYQSSLMLHSSSDGIAEVLVTDMLGRIITRNNFALSAGKSASYSIDLSNQSTGEYFYTVLFASMNGTVTKSGKVMVLR